MKILVGCQRFIACLETFFLLLMRFKSFGTGIWIYRLIFVGRGNRDLTKRETWGNGINEDDTRQGNPNHIGWPAYRRNFIPILSSLLLLARKAPSLLRRCLTSCVKRGSSGVSTNLSIGTSGPRGLENLNKLQLSGYLNIFRTNNFITNCRERLLFSKC